MRAGEPRSSALNGFDNGTDSVVLGRVKWYDVIKGYGFVVPSTGGPDIMVHASVVRAFGRMALPDGAPIRLKATRGDRGLHATEVLEVEDPDPAMAPLAGAAGDEMQRPAPAGGEEGPRPTEFLPEGGVVGPLVPARVKWFDKQKGFGFVNVFGNAEDVFVHMETVRRCGFQDLTGGEGMSCRTFRGPRGLMVAELQLWEAGIQAPDEGEAD